LRSSALLLLWGLAAGCGAESLPEALRACADRFDAAQRLDAALPEATDDKSTAKVEARPADAPLMSLALDCPEAIGAVEGPVPDELGLAERRMTTLDWRALAATVERRSEPPAQSGTGDAGARLEAILAELAPAPLTGLEGRVLWRERLQAWALRQLRSLFGPETAIGRWLDSLTADDLRAFSQGVLALVLVLFTLLIAAIAVVLYRFLASRRGRGVARPQVELPEGLARVPLLPAARIRELPAAAQALALMRLVVARIDEDGLCAVRASMTNSEVAASLAAATDLHIDRIAGLADRSLFGGHEASAAELAPCWAEVETLGVRPT
jgi:hypothetical protein